MRKGIKITPASMMVAVASILGAAALSSQPVAAWANENHQQQPPQPQPKNLPSTGPKEDIAVVIGVAVTAVIGYEVVMMRKSRHGSPRPVSGR